MSSSAPDRPTADTAPPDPRFAVSTVRDGLHPVLELHGELDLGSAPVLDEEVDRVDPSPGGTLVLDLSHLAFVDSSGLRAILGAEGRVRERGARLVLVRGPRAVERVFALTGTDRHLTFLD